MPRISEGQYALGGLTFIFVWTFVILPLLNYPSPSGPKSGSPPQTHSQQATNESGSEPRGTAHAPLVVRVLKSAEEAAQEAESSHEKATTDRWLMLFTGAVAAATVALVWATVLLQQTTKRAAEKQAADMLASLAESRKSVKVAEKSADAAKEAADIAKRTLVETDRPWIAIQAKIAGPLTFGPSAKIPTDGSEREVNVEISIDFSLTNIGKSPAAFVIFEPMLCADLGEAAIQAEELANQYIGSLRPYGRVMFPGDIWPDEYILAVSRAKFMRRLEEIVRKFADDEDANTLNLGYHRPAVLICVYYRLVGEQKARHTILIFEVWAKGPRPSWLGRE